MTNLEFSSAAEAGQHLNRLYNERAFAEAEGLLANEEYTADLEAAIATLHSAYVGAAVTEIAVLRGELNGRLQG